jgi:hypothetical protein
MVALLGFIALALGLGLISDRLGTREAAIVLMAAVLMAWIYFVIPRVI